MPPSSEPQDSLRLVLPAALRERLELLRIAKQWPEIMTPERIAALALTRTLYDLGVIEDSRDAYEMADCPHIAWVLFGLPIKDQLAQLSDETDLWLQSLGESPKEGDQTPPPA